MATAEHLASALTYCINFAKVMLSKSGAFYPFGASLGASGKITAIGGWDGNAHPAPADIYKFISDSLRSEARKNNIVGSAIAVDVNIPQQYGAPWSDGLRVHIESPEYSRYIYVPYQISKSGLMRTQREVTFADPIAVEVGHEVFVDQSAQ